MIKNIKTQRFRGDGYEIKIGFGFSFVFCFVWGRAKKFIFYVCCY